jgi:hypothetical protein
MRLNATLLGSQHARTPSVHLEACIQTRLEHCLQMESPVLLSNVKETQEV